MIAQVVRGGSGKSFARWFLSVMIICQHALGRNVLCAKKNPPSEDGGFVVVRTLLEPVISSRGTIGAGVVFKSATKL